MSFLARLLGMTGTGGWIVYLVIAGAIYGLGIISGIKLDEIAQAPKISQLKTDVATAKGETERQKTALAVYSAREEANRADANRIAAEQAAANAAALARASQQLKDAENARRKATLARDDALRAIPQADTSPLSPGARAWYDSLRDEQHARANPITP